MHQDYKDRKSLVKSNTCVSSNLSISPFMSKLYIITKVHILKTYYKWPTTQSQQFFTKMVKNPILCTYSESNTLVPWVRVTRVLPTFFTWKTEGALMSYQSFLEKGSALQIHTQTKPIFQLKINTAKKEKKHATKYRNGRY